MTNTNGKTSFLEPKTCQIESCVHRSISWLTLMEKPRFLSLRLNIGYLVFNEPDLIIIGRV